MDSSTGVQTSGRGAMGKERKGQKSGVWEENDHKRILSSDSSSAGSVLVHLIITLETGEKLPMPEVEFLHLSSVWNPEMWT